MVKKTVVLYHYFEASEDYKKNLHTFLQLGYRADVDYIIIIAGGCSIELPRLNNVKYVYAPNFQFDYGGYSLAVQSALDVHAYDYFLFVNSSVRGPFVPDIGTRAWTEIFTGPLSSGVKLVGSTINILDPQSPYVSAFKTQYNFDGPFSHVQTMAFCMDKEALLHLIDYGFFGRPIGASKDDAIIHYELLLSQLILRKGWNISCVVPEYRAIDYRKEHVDVNPTSVHGDPCYPGAYFGRTLRPAELIFVKTNRSLIDSSALVDLANRQLSTAADAADVFRLSDIDRYLRSIPSAWRGHKNFAIWLVNELKPKVTVDLGVDYGYSTFCLAAPGIGEVYGINSFEGDKQAGLRNTYQDVVAATRQLGINNITFLKGYFQNVAMDWSNRINILHIGGLQTYEAVKLDFETWVKFVEDDGVVLLHDTCVSDFGAHRLFVELNYPKVNFKHAGGLGVISRSVGIVNKITSIFSTLISAPPLNIRRNDPCFCGSGKRFKNCHGRQMAN